MLERHRLRPAPIQAVGADLFEAGGMLLRVLRGEGRRGTGITMGTVQARDIRFARR